jgi:hypothetical protein
MHVFIHFVSMINRNLACIIIDIGSIPYFCIMHVLMDLDCILYLFIEIASLHPSCKFSFIEQLTYLNLSYHFFHSSSVLYIFIILNLLTLQLIIVVCFHTCISSPLDVFINLENIHQ